MAKASWLTLTPDSGNGNGSIQNSATTHKGRTMRETTVTLTAVGASEPATYVAKQKGTSEYVTFNDGEEMSAPKAGGQVTVNGKSNSQSLTFAWVGDNKNVELPATYTAGGKSTNNGSDIEGDPGSIDEFEFSTQLTFPANETTEEVDRVLKVTAKGGQEKQITIKQAAGDAFITVEPKEITLEADGTAVSVTVKSNTQWSAS